MQERWRRVEVRGRVVTCNSLETVSSVKDSQVRCSMYAEAPSAQQDVVVARGVTFDVKEVCVVYIDLLSMAP